MLLNEQDTVKISDFGVSVRINGKDDTVRDTAGTPAFFCPEAAKGNNKLLNLIVF